MVDVVMPSPLQIPTVTIEDLYAFHTHNFGSPAPRQSFPVEDEPHNEAGYGEAFQAQDDNLGYYPDGVKRTLTDDQIAMFRHSEIYSILRERQVRKENLEADGGEQSEDMVSRPTEVVEATALSEEEGEARSDEEVKEVISTISEKTPPDVEVTNAGKKRKRGDADNGFVHSKKYASRSARGLVRELDSAAIEEQVLDYGDEASTVEAAKQTEAVATQVADQDQESQAPPAEGKRIWWPIIEVA